MYEVTGRRLQVGDCREDFAGMRLQAGDCREEISGRKLQGGGHREGVCRIFSFSTCNICSLDTYILILN